MKRISLILLILLVFLLVSGCTSATEDHSSSITTTTTTVPTSATTLATTVPTTTTVEATTATVLPTTTTPLATTTVYIPDPTPEFEGTVLEIDGDDVLIRVDKVTEGPPISGTVWANKNSLWKHHGGNVWVVDMPITVTYTGELTKSDPPRLKTVVMFCDCLYYMQTNKSKTTITSLTTTDPQRTKTSKLTTTT